MIDATAERLICRELYGHLVSLAVRPFSAGNDSALIEAEHRVRALLDSLEGAPRVVLGAREVNALESMMRLSPLIGVREVARTVAGSVHAALLRHSSPAEGFPAVYTRPPQRKNELRRIIVAVGPTIGIGDEVLAARAILERARRIGFVVEVESARPELWRCLDDTVVVLGGPPLAAADRLSALATSEQLATTLLHVDFLTSDPGEVPWFLPESVGASARWIFGNATGVLADVSRRMLHYIRYPDGYPEARLLEARWMAARLLTGGFEPRSPTTEERGRPSIARKASSMVVLQVLTSKPSLLFSAGFYARCFQRLSDLLGGEVQVRVLRGTSPSTASITRKVAAEIGTVLPSGSVEELGPLSFAEIREQLLIAAALFGPDTFTSHLAALFGTPHVMLQLNEHRAWASPASPTFVVSLRSDSARLVESTARRLKFLLEGAVSNDALYEIAPSWRAHIRQLGAALDRSIDTDEPLDVESCDSHVDAVHRLISAGENIAIEVLGDSSDSSGRRAPVPLRKYPSADASRALARWYQRVGCSDLSALCFASTA